MRRLDSSSDDFRDQLRALDVPMEDAESSVVTTVAEILDAVRSRGVAALLEYTARYDDLKVDSLSDLAIEKDELEQALASLPLRQRAALEAAAQRIQDFHQRQLAEGWSFEDAHGNTLGQRVTPLDGVGVYVPGGKASYPSSVLMNVIPARVAGVPRITMVSPTPKGERNPLVLAAAAIAGVDRVFTIGGAQAVAALTYGVDGLESVDKIVGPGNRFVAEAKRQVFGRVAIDMIAGPSEILIIADGSAPADWVAMDLFSQAEHDEVAQALMLCPDENYIDAVAASIRALLPTMPRADVIEASLTARGALIKTRDLTHAAAISNEIAPEHLELAVENPEALLPQISSAGAIFMGAYSCESLGDYCAGPNHVLPTSGTARFFSPLGVYDFQKRSSIIACTATGAKPLARIAAELADGEGLSAHAQSARMRLTD